MTAAAKLSPRDAKRARDLAERLENISHELDPMERSFFVTEGRHLGLALAPRKRVARDVGPDRKAQRKDERRERAKEIRAAVFARAAGRCEWSYLAAPAAQPMPTEWHHVIGGGLRRHRESVETTCAICTTCHRGWERGNDIVLDWALGWAKRNGFTEAQAAIEKRIAKVSEARSPRGGRQEGRTG
jgi:hypothetical protein